MSEKTPIEKTPIHEDQLVLLVDAIRAADRRWIEDGALGRYFQDYLLPEMLQRDMALDVRL